MSSPEDSGVHPWLNQDELVQPTYLFGDKFNIIAYAIIHIITQGLYGFL